MHQRRQFLGRNEEEGAQWLLLMHRCNIGDTLIQGEWGYISGRPHNFLAASTPSPIPCLPYLLTSVSLDMCTHFERFLGFKRVSEFGNLYLVEFSKDRSIILLLSLRFSLFSCHSLSLFSLFTFKHWLLPRGVFITVVIQRFISIDMCIYIYFYRESYGQFPFRINCEQNCVIDLLKCLRRNIVKCKNLCEFIFFLSKIYRSVYTWWMDR